MTARPKKKYKRLAPVRVGRTGDRVGEGRWVLPVFNFASPAAPKGMDVLLMYQGFWSIDADDRAAGEPVRRCRNNDLQAMAHAVVESSDPAAAVVLRMMVDGWFDLCSFDKDDCGGDIVAAAVEKIEEHIVAVMVGPEPVAPNPLWDFPDYDECF